MKIKTGDKVKVISGKERGKTGKVTQVLKNKQSGLYYVVVDGLNIMRKHLKTRKKGEKGQVLELFAPLAASKVMLIENKEGKPTRVGYKREGDVKKRVAKRNQEYID